MSRTTRAIAQINRDLDRISGLDGIVADKMEELAKHVNALVEDILLNHSNANLFDYEGSTVYEIIAYDKDAAMEVSLQKDVDYADIKAQAMKFGEQCRLDLLLNPATGQPFDWVKLVNADNWDIVYWASYNR